MFNNQLAMINRKHKYFRFALLIEYWQLTIGN